MANIARLKARLSYYLSQVRQGEVVLVLDRKTPIAKVEACGPAEGLRVSEPGGAPASLKDVRYPALKSKTDAVGLLLEERGGR
ncbi:MAG: hypothetical protein HY922_00740 [Elusimicrobia bacterium]|nr:hypothetical protein [Elusimicrobiota bacterium]